MYEILEIIDCSSNRYSSKLLKLLFGVPEINYLFLEYISKVRIAEYEEFYSIIEGVSNQ